MEFNNIAPTTAQINDEVELLTNTLVMKGATIEDFDDDMVVVSCKSKNSFDDIIDLLDDNDLIDEYTIDVWHHDPSGITKKAENDEIDVSRIDNFNNITVEIIAFFNPDYVTYTYYQDINESYIDTNRTVPVWIKINKIKTSAPNGQFIVVPHPTKTDCVCISAVYYVEDGYLSDFVSENNNKMIDDLNNINNGIINKLLISNNYTLTTPINLNVDTFSYGTNNLLETNIAVYMSNSGKVDLTHLYEQFDGVFVGDVGVLNEIERKLKINFRGKKRIKLKCQKGYKFDPSRKACVKIAGNELATMRKSKIKMVRTKKAKGASFKRAVNRKVKKAMRFRKMMGK